MFPDVWNPFYNQSCLLSAPFPPLFLEAEAPKTIVPKLASLVVSEVLPIQETGKQLEDGRRRENISLFLAVLQAAQWQRPMGPSAPVQTAWLHGGSSSECSQAVAMQSSYAHAAYFGFPTSITNKNLEHKSHQSLWVHADCWQTQQKHWRA